MEDRFGVAELVWELSQARQTGVLEIRSPEGLACVHFVDGWPVFVESSSLHDSLGRLMLGEGLLTQEQYAQALRRMTDDLIAGEDVRFGEVVVELGFVTADQVVTTLRRQVKEKLVNLCHLVEPEMEFRVGREYVAGGGGSFRADPCEIVLEGVRRHYGPARLEGLIARHGERHVGLAADFEKRRPSFRFTASEERFVNGLRGDRTVKQVIDFGDLDRVHAMQVLYALLLTGSVELSEVPLVRTPAPSRAARPVEPSGGRARAEGGRGQARAAARPTAEGAAMRVPVVPGARSEALPDDERRRRSDEFAAEAAFQEGLRELVTGKPMAAALAFSKARALCPREPEYGCYELWARCLAAIVQGSKVEEAAREARARMEALLVSSPPRPRALYALALASQVLGELDAAREHLRAALAFDPTFADARALLDELDPTPASTARRR